MRVSDNLLIILCAMVVAMGFLMYFDKDIGYIICGTIVAGILYIVNMFMSYKVLYKEMNNRIDEFDKMLAFFEKHPESARHSGSNIGFKCD